MRWGFERPGLGVVNNSRSDKLSGPMWRDAYQNRRCLIPAAAFYEWSGPKGRKRTHRFDAPDEGWLWIAGLWEECPRLGACFSMITTDANSLMAPIHDRMPAVLAPAELMPYLQGLVARFAPPSEALRVMDAPNPLVKHKPESVQGELF